MVPAPIERSEVWGHDNRSENLQDLQRRRLLSLVQRRAGCSTERSSEFGSVNLTLSPVAGFSLNWNQGTGALLVPIKNKVMVATSKIILPYQPGYVGNKEADKRRKQTKEQLRQREREFAERQQPPLIVPERLKADQFKIVDTDVAVIVAADNFRSGTTDDHG
jgi:hypothetical protein